MSLEIDQVHCMDVRDFLKVVAEGTVDLIIADPPYFSVLSEAWDNQWPNSGAYLDWMLDWTHLCVSAMKPGASLYVFGGIGPKNGFVFWDYVQRASKFLSFASYINWRRFRGKGYGGLHNNWPDSREDIAFFVKGQRPRTFNKQRMREAGLSSTSKRRFAQTGVGLACTNIWIDIPEAQLDGGMNRTLSNPAEKPVRLMERIVNASSDPGDLVIDPFVGTGSSAVAAIKLKRTFLGCDLNKEYCAEARWKIIATKEEVQNEQS